MGLAGYAVLFSHGPALTKVPAVSDPDESGSHPG